MNQEYNKAFVPVGVMVLLAVLGSLGVTPEMSVQDAVYALVVSFLVWLTPNKPKGI